MIAIAAAVVGYLTVAAIAAIAAAVLGRALRAADPARDDLPDVPGWACPATRCPDTVTVTADGNLKEVWL